MENRIEILTGPKNTYDQLLDVGKRLRAIHHIYKELQDDRVPETDPQMQQANDLLDRIRQNFHSTVRETFTTLWYPTSEGLRSTEFYMRFQGNQYNGEDQIREVLKDQMKFEEDTSSDTFRRKCETRLFTQQSMPWSEIKRRAAIHPIWQWHAPGALDTLKADCIFKEIWRENGGYVDKGPFPQNKTSVTIRELRRNDDTGEVVLRVTPTYGDVIYWDVGRQVSPASQRLDGNELSTRELRLSFLCLDSTNQHECGDPVIWNNTITLKYRIYQKGEEKMMELRAAPPAEIYYTTDGSSPKTNGARYIEPFSIPKNAQVVLAYATKDEIVSNIENIPIHWESEEEIRVDPLRPAKFLRKQKTNSTQETYTLLETLLKYKGELSGLTLTIGGDASTREWLEMSTSEEKRIQPQQILAALGVLRQIQTEGQVILECEVLHFSSGQELLDWIAAMRIDLRPAEVSQ